MIFTGTIEAFEVGQMPNISDEKFDNAYAVLLSASIHLAKLRENLDIYQHQNTYLLVKNGEVISTVLLTPCNISGESYLHIGGFYLKEAYRKGTATYWFLHGLKEFLSVPLIADGAIFKDGMGLIDAVIQHKIFTVKRLNKDTGKKTELTEPINDFDHCYLFCSAHVGCGRYIVEDQFSYFPLFGDL